MRLRNKTLLELFPDAECVFEGLIQQFFKYLRKFLMTIGSLQVQSTDISDQSMLEMREDKWNLISEAIPDAMHGFLELIKRTKLLELFQVLAQYNKVEGLHIVESKSQDGSGHYFYLEIFPTGFFVAHLHLDLFYLDSLEDILDGILTRMLIFG